MGEATPGYELPLRLFAAFRTVIEATHAELARQGHPDVRPMHGFVFQAIGIQGITAVELAARLGVTKQAAGKTIGTLEKQGYIERARDPADARRKIVRLNAKGVDVLAKSAQAFDAIQAQWAQVLGAERLTALQDDLRTLTPGELFRLDAPGWLSGGQ